MSLAGYTFREGTAEDAPGLVALDSSFSTEWVLHLERAGDAIEQSITLRWRRVKPAGSRRSFEVAERPLRKELAATDRFAVAESAGSIAGYVTIDERWNRTAEITSIIVDAAHRGTGLGRHFVARAESFARERGLRAVGWEAQTDNRAAIEFAVSRGFRIAGVHDAFYRNDDLARQEAAGFRGIAVFMTKAID